MSASMNRSASDVTLDRPLARARAEKRVSEVRARAPQDELRDSWFDPPPVTRGSDPPPSSAPRSKSSPPTGDDEVDAWLK